MTPHLAPKTALAALAAAGLFLPFCAALPAVAGAAPSSSSAAKLRECLRAAADMHETTFGGRYVTAEDVARCMEAFRPGSSGGASGGGNASSPKSTKAGGDGRNGGGGSGTPKSPSSSSSGGGGGGGKSLPERFTIKDENGASSDCRVEGDTVNCSISIPRQGGIDVQTGTVTGKVDGLTVTGTGTYHVESHSLADASCTGTEDYSGPVSYKFSPSGTVNIRVGPNQAQGTYYCNGRQNSNSWVTPGGAVESTGTWSPSG